MKITFKLFATLTDYLPVAARRSNIIELEVAPDASISQIIEPFGMPPKLVHLVLVNGHYIQPEKRLTHTLAEGDVLAIWPPIAGGQRLQSFYAEQFERDMGCTETEWLGWLPAAIGSHAWQKSGAVVQVAIAPGHLTLQWQVAPTRVLGGLARIPRLLVQFAFTGLSEQERYGFMKRFDLYMQRGGG